MRRSQCIHGWAILELYDSLSMKFGSWAVNKQGSLYASVTHQPQLKILIGFRKCYTAHLNGNLNAYFLSSTMSIVLTNCTTHYSPTEVTVIVRHPKFSWLALAKFFCNPLHQVMQTRWVLNMDQLSEVQVRLRRIRSSTTTMNHSDTVRCSTLCYLSKGIKMHQIREIRK